MKRIEVISRCEILNHGVMIVLFTMAAFCLGVPMVSAAPPYVPENVFEWVQSSSRMNYYFNKEQICYGVDAAGQIDLNTLIVPTLMTYDDVQVQDVVDKRRWKMLPVEGFDNLVGETEYLRIDLAKGTVTVEELDYVDGTWTNLDVTHPDEVTEISKLSEKSVDRVFYTKIMEYAQKHQAEVIDHTQGTLSKADQAVLEKARKAEIQQYIAQDKKQADAENK